VICRKILITGGNGFIGCHVAEHFYNLGNGNHVRIIDINDDPTFRHLKNKSAFCSEFICGDLRDETVCRRAVDGIDWIMHFAANMGGMGTIHPSNGFEIYKQNHFMTLNLLQAAVEANVELFLYTSSACVYPCRIQRDNNNLDLKLKESDALAEGIPDPQDLYGTEKFAGEILVSHFAASMNVRIARLHNV